MEATIKIGGGGRLAFIYCDDLAPLLALGDASVTRVSNVEPAPFNGSIGWTADMALSHGPVLGPFASRQEALDAEIEWLRVKRGL